MSLAAKMLQQNGITPAADVDDKNQNGGPTGDHDGNSTEGNTDDNTSGSDASGEQGGQTSGTNNGTGSGGGSSENHDHNDLSEEAILRGLAKQGIKVNSLKDLVTTGGQTELTQEQKDELEQKRQNEVRTFALQTGKVTSTQFDNYVRESSLPTQDLAYKIYKEERIAELKAGGTEAGDMPDEESLLSEFRETHHLYADDDDPKRKRGEKILKRQVEDYLKGKYSNIYNLDDEFKEHSTVETQRTSYNNVVNNAFSTIGNKLEFTIKDDTNEDFSFPVKFSDAELAAARSVYENEETFSSLGRSSDLKQEDITQAVRSTLTGKHFPRILKDFSFALVAKKQEQWAKGRRNIIDTTGTGDAGEKTTSPGVKKMLDRARSQNNI